jgi:hypothetical protein
LGGKGPSDSRETTSACVPQNKCFRVACFSPRKLPLWANNGSCVEDIWKHFKDIVCGAIERFVPHKVLEQIAGLEYGNKKVKHLEAKVRRAYNRRKFGEHYQAELKGLSKELLTVKKSAQETFFCIILRNERKSWSECYKYVNRRKRSKGNIPTIKDCNGVLITDTVGKANNLNIYYLVSVFSCERDFPEKIFNEHG